MADETHNDKPDAPSDEAATEPTAAAEPDTAPEPVAAAEPAAASSSGLRRRVAVPVWALGLVALVVVGLVGFGIGRWTAPDDDEEVSGAPPGQVEEGAPAIDPDFPIPADRVVLGVTVDDSTDPDGAEVVQVLDRGPAGEAGLESGDVITAVDGDDDVTNTDQLADAVQEHDSGDEVTITYERDGESEEADVTLESFSSLTPRDDDEGTSSTALGSR